MAPPVYQTLHRPDFKGVLFQFEHDGEQYLASSIHQGGAARGVEVFRDNDPKPVTFKKRIHKQQDLQVWTFTADSTPPEQLLTYHPNPEVEVGDRIYLLNKGEKIPATVAALPSGANFRHSYRTDEPFAAAGMSGSPVYLPRTGSVIGVLQTANHRKKATYGGFELLKMK